MHRSSIYLSFLAAGLAVVFTGCGMSSAAAQSAPEDQPHDSNVTLAQAAPSSEPGDTSDRHRMMPHGMMGSGRMEGMMRMRGLRMKIMFAIADADGDGALSFEEVTAIHRRVFNAVDVNKDGKVTRDEIRAFIRD
jgi:EF hand